MSLPQELWDKEEKEFLQAMFSIFNEINFTRKILSQHIKKTFRSQLCLYFILIDSFSRIEQIFAGKREDELNTNNEARFRSWLDRYIFTQENKYFKKYRGGLGGNSKNIWLLRNSFLHFFSLPPADKVGGYIVVSFGTPPPIFKKLYSKIKQEKKKDVIELNAHHLIDAIHEGYLLQLKCLTDMITGDPVKYTESAKYAHKILMEQSAVPVSLKNEDGEMLWSEKD